MNNNEMSMDEKILDKMGEAFVLMREYIKQTKKQKEELEVSIEKQKVMETEIETLKNKVETIRMGVILSEENANRIGRPPITDFQIRKIRELLAKGMSQRDVAEAIDCSLGTVNKYANTQGVYQREKKASGVIEQKPSRNVPEPLEPSHVFTNSNDYKPKEINGIIQPFDPR